jgi:outer membrane phospholipase A
VEGEEQLNKYIMNYFKSLFGEPERNNLKLNESWWRISLKSHLWRMGSWKLSSQKRKCGKQFFR